MQLVNFKEITDITFRDSGVKISVEIRALFDESIEYEACVQDLLSMDYRVVGKIKNCVLENCEILFKGKKTLDFQKIDSKMGGANLGYYLYPMYVFKFPHGKKYSVIPGGANYPIFISSGNSLCFEHSLNTLFSNSPVQFPDMRGKTK